MFLKRLGQLLSRSPLWQRLARRFGRVSGFGFVGILVLLAGILALYILIEVLGVNARLANLVVTIVSIEGNFMLNRSLTWRDRVRPGTPRQRWVEFWQFGDRWKDFWRHWRRYHVIPAITVPLNQALFNLLISIAVPWWAAVFIGQVFVTVARYIWLDKVAFRDATQTRPEDVPIVGQPGPSRISVIIPVQSENTLRACIDALLAQTYQAHEIIVVTNRDNPALKPIAKEIANGVVKVAHFVRPTTWVGRDANARRLRGMQIATGNVFALTDARIFVPRDWLEKIAILIGNGESVVAGITMRMPDDKRFRALFLDEGLLSENVRYRSPYLDDTNFGRVSGLPVTACLAIASYVFEATKGDFPEQGFSGWEDFALSSHIIRKGFRIRTTNQLYTHRMHRVGFRIAKHFVTGMAARSFYLQFRNNPFAAHRHNQATLVALGMLIGLGSVVGLGFALGVIASLEIHAILLALILAILGVLNAIRAGKLVAVLFPPFILVQLVVWVVGYWLSAILRGKIPPWLAEFLRGLRLFQF